jgi:hypothetical protein
MSRVSTRRTAGVPERPWDCHRTGESSSGTAACRSSARALMCCCLRGVRSARSGAIGRPSWCSSVRAAATSNYVNGSRICRRTPCIGWTSSCTTGSGCGPCSQRRTSRPYPYVTRGSRWPCWRRWSALCRWWPRTHRELKHAAGSARHRDRDRRPAGRCRRSRGGPGCHRRRPRTQPQAGRLGTLVAEMFSLEDMGRRLAKVLCRSTYDNWPPDKP